MLKISRAPIPSGAIGLAKAFELVCGHRIADEHIISAEKSYADEFVAVNGTPIPESDKAGRDRSETLGRLRRDLAISEHLARTEADRIFREALASGALVARISKNNDDREVADIGEWFIPPLFEYEPGFRSDYVSEWHERDDYGNRRILRPIPEQPGPPTNFDDGTLYRVFLNQAEFTAWLAGSSLTRLIPPPTGKQSKLWKYFEENFSGTVPPPADEPRKTLRGKLLQWDKALHPLDDDTLKKAIDRYNESLAARGR